MIQLSKIKDYASMSQEEIVNYLLDRGEHELQNDLGQGMIYTIADLQQEGIWEGLRTQEVYEKIIILDKQGYLNMIWFISSLLQELSPCELPLSCKITSEECYIVSDIPFWFEKLINENESFKKNLETHLSVEKMYAFFFYFMTSFLNHMIYNSNPINQKKIEEESEIEGKFILNIYPSRINVIYNYSCSNYKERGYLDYLLSDLIEIFLIEEKESKKDIAMLVEKKETGYNFKIIRK